MFEVRIEKTIACAHRLFDYNGPCEALHGHNYRIEVAYSGTQTDGGGMLVDFALLKQALDDVLDKLDHAYLNDLPAFRDLSPSAENIARHVFDALKTGAAFEFAKIKSVSVWETPTQVAVYRQD